MKTFAPGDLVVVKKQTQTTVEKGPAKARMQARGPYRILEQVKPGTYRIQRLPGIKGAGRRGRVTKESAARLTKIPSTLVLHKPTEGIDTRLATYRHAIVDNPLENILGLHEPGRHKQADGHRPFAYDKVEDLWSDDIDNNWPQMMADDSDDDNTSSDSSDDDIDHDIIHYRDTDDDTNINNEIDHNTSINDNQNANDTEPANTAENDNNGQEPQATTEENTNETNTDVKNNSNPKRDQRKRETNSKPATTQRTTPREEDSDNDAKLPAKKKQKVSREESQPPTRTSGRTTRRPTRYAQQERTKQTRPHEATPAEIIEQHTKLKRAHQLYKSIRISRDKIFFIKHKIDTTNTWRWYVVQVKLDDDDKEITRNEGKYRVWFYIREHANSKSRQLRNCRYWPEVHKLRLNGMLGKIIPVRPGRVETVSREQSHRYKVYEHTVDLLKDALVGPFDFAVPRHYQNESHRIAFEEWEDLKSAAQQHYHKH